MYFYVFVLYIYLYIALGSIFIKITYFKFCNNSVKYKRQIVYLRLDVSLLMPSFRFFLFMCFCILQAAFKLTISNQELHILGNIQEYNGQVLFFMNYYE